MTNPDDIDPNEGQPTTDQLLKQPLAGMIGGTQHYNIGGLDVNRFCMANGWDPCARDILRYVSRHRLKDGKQDLLKGLHYVGIRQALITEYPFWQGLTFSRYTIWDFLRENAPACHPEPVETALVALSAWVAWNEERHREALIEALNELIQGYDNLV